MSAITQTIPSSTRSFRFGAKFWLCFVGFLLLNWLAQIYRISLELSDDPSESAVDAAMARADILVLILGLPFSALAAPFGHGLVMLWIAVPNSALLAAIVAWPSRSRGNASSSMQPSDPVRTYIDLKPGEGYPRVEHVFYECLQCGGVVPAISEDVACCACRNIVIDAPQGRMNVKDHSKVRLFRMST